MGKNNAGKKRTGRASQRGEVDLEPAGSKEEKERRTSKSSTINLKLLKSLITSQTFSKEACTMARKLAAFLAFPNCSTIYCGLLT